MSLWETQGKELVGIGDMVALTYASETDMVGRIVAATAGGQVQCLVVRGRLVKQGGFVEVDAEQLLLRVYS